MAFLVLVGVVGFCVLFGFCIYGCWGIDFRSFLLLGVVYFGFWFVSVLCLVVGLFWCDLFLAGVVWFRRFD